MKHRNRFAGSDRPQKEVYHEAEESRICSVETTPQSQRSWPFSKPLEFLQKVKYGGVVGKLTAISVAALLVVAVTMVSAWGNETVHLTGLGIVVLIVFGAFWKITKTLDKHPELALLEGAEFIKYRQQEIAAKSISAIPVTLAIADPSPPPLQQIEGPTDDEER